MAAPIFLEMSKAGRLGCDVWLVHLTGEEFPSDCLGARALSRVLVERRLHARTPPGEVHGHWRSATARSLAFHSRICQVHRQSSGLIPWWDGGGPGQSCGAEFPSDPIGHRARPYRQAMQPGGAK